MLLIKRLSNGMKKCEQGEELLVKVLSPSRHHEDIIGPVHAANASEQWRCCMMKIEVHKTWTRGELPPNNKRKEQRLGMVWPLPSPTFKLSTVQ